MFQRRAILENASPPLKLLVLVFVILVSLLFTLIFAIVLGFAIFGGGMLDYVRDGLELTDPAFLPVIQYLQIINTIGLFLLPAIVFAIIAGRSPWRYLSMRVSPQLFTIILGSAVIIAILPFISWLAEVNGAMALPEWLSGLEDWMRRSEDQAMELTELFLSTSTIGGLAINLLMIAVLPALGEEFLFRGLVLRLFREWTGNPHIAVLISALLFSALHLQFYGFLPRFILGIVLGYLFVWTRSIWVPVIIHFVNNGIAVVGGWYYARGGIEKDIESIGQAEQTWVIAASFFVVVFFMILIRLFENKKKGSTIDASP
ncbi:MAG: type II CAAX endopeptidase family protein [Bacteroidales bacterium]|jgi:membrane protease YdiL (CAAX protease family)|nr:type II CAAX endopeptidase family protein [Bacteroidales bacterium]